MKISLAVIALFFLAVPPTYAQTYAQTMYQVEIIAFARDSADVNAEEDWSSHPALRYPEKIITLQAMGSGNGFQLLPSEGLLLTNEATAIRNRRNMRVLAHLGWQQPGDDASRAISILIVGGKQFGNHHELEGSVTLAIEHFLKFDVNLWLNRFSTSATGETIALPNVPGTVIDDTSGTHVSTQTVLLQEQRRMRSGELHYFDHPKFGVIALIKPVTAATSQ